MKKIVVIIFLSLLSLACFAKELILTIQPKFSTSFGSLEDYLYADQTQTTLRSYLEWQERFIPNLELNFITTYKNLEFTAGALYSLPFNKGKMLDKDWVADIQTNLGEFNNKLLYKYGFSGEFSYHFKPTNYLTVAPAINLQFSKIQFSGENGIGWYGDHNHSTNQNDESYDSHYAKKYKLYDITYSRNSLYYFIGSNLDFSFKAFHIKAGLFISPYCYLSSLDHHTDGGKNEQNFKTHMVNNNFFGAYRTNLELTYLLNSKVSLFIQTDLLWTRILKAQTETDLYRGLSATPDGVTYIEWTYLGYISASKEITATIKLGCNIIL